MASGSWTFGTSNKYITGRIRWSSSSNGSAANSSNVYVYLDYMKSSSSTASTRGTLAGYLCGSYYSKSVTLSCNNVYQNVAYVAYTVGHSSNGSGSTTISASGGISGTTFSSSSTSSTVTLDKIPRYAAISSFKNTAVTQTSATFSWSTDVTVKAIYLYLNNSSSASISKSISATSGTLVCENLEPGVTYNAKITVTRSDSGLNTTSSNISFTTTPIATIINEDVSFVIGNDLSLSFKDYDKNTFYLKLDVKKVDDTWETDVITVDEVLNSESYDWSLSTFSAILYQKVITRNKAEIRIRCGTTIGESQKEHSVSGMMSVENSNPAFSTYSYGDADTSTQAILGNTSYMPSGYGEMQAHISVANQAVAQNYAQIISYVATVYNSSNVLMVSKTVDFKSDEQVDISFGNFKTADTYTININAVDSRGNISSVITRTFYVLDYHIPQVSVVGERQNGYEADTTFIIKASYSKLLINDVSKNNSFNIKYRYAIAGQPLPDDYTTISSILTDTSVTDTVDTDEYKTATIMVNISSSNSFNFEFVSTDKLNNPTVTKVSIGQGIPLMAQMEDGHVTVGCVPDFDNESLLQVGSDIMATDSDGTKVNILNKINEVDTTLSNDITTINNNCIKVVDSKKTTTNGYNYEYSVLSFGDKRYVKLFGNYTIKNAAGTSLSPFTYNTITNLGLFPVNITTKIKKVLDFSLDCFDPGSGLFFIGGIKKHVAETNVYANVQFLMTNQPQNIGLEWMMVCEIE